MQVDSFRNESRTASLNVTGKSMAEGDMAFGEVDDGQNTKRTS